MTQAQATAYITAGVQSGQYPRLVYKYRAFNPHTQSLFQDHRLWFANPISFNDPFDCQIRDLGNYTRDDVFNYLCQLSVPDTQAAQAVDQLFRNPGQITQWVESSIRDVINSKGILSLSENRDNILMWSHYTNSHEGFVLGFDILADIPFFTIPLHVRYSPDYPSFQYLKEKDKIVSHGMLTKTDFWSYEREIRMIKPTQGLQQFQKQALVEVILGCRITDANRQALIQHLRDYDYLHVALYQARPSTSRYALELDRIAFP